jgi:hypothetical protein
LYLIAEVNVLNTKLFFQIAKVFFLIALVCVLIELFLLTGKLSTNIAETGLSQNYGFFLKTVCTSSYSEAFLPHNEALLSHSQAVLLLRRG